MTKLASACMPCQCIPRVRDSEVSPPNKIWVLKLENWPKFNAFWLVFSAFIGKVHRHYFMLCFYIAPSMRRREFYCEEIDHRTTVSLRQPLTTRELVDTARCHVFHVLYFMLLVLAATFICIVTEGDVPLVWILPAVSAISVVSFHQLNL